MRWAAGNLFLYANPGDGIFSIPEGGGASSTVVDTYPWDFWTEGDRLLYATLESMPGATSSSESPLKIGLRSVPLTGRTTGELADNVLSATLGKASHYIGIAWALDDEGLYWGSIRYEGTPSTTTWKIEWALRSGGEKQTVGEYQFAADEGSGFNMRLLPVGDRLLAFAQAPLGGSPVLSFPKGGGNPVKLPSGPGRPQGIAFLVDGTVIWQRTANPGDGMTKRSDRYEVTRLLPGAEAVEAFWPEKPPWAYLMDAWSDGHGGAYAYVWEWGTDDARHITIWNIDADGAGRRLGCDPLVGNVLGVTAVSPDALYAVVNHDWKYWEVVRIAREPGSIVPP